jgi:glycosyltransferase involved in cell wall biosynthesis
MRKPLSASKVLIVSLARNCEDVIEKEVLIINSAFSEAKTVNWLVIESDSDDGTLTRIQKLAKNDKFEFITLGKLQNKYPKRTERIAKCRNRYLEELRANKKYNDVDYVVVADLDGVNSELTAMAVKSCWELAEDWDACFANQSKAYYDVWALRHKTWCPSDCWKTYNFLFNNGVSKFAALQAAVYSRMIRINSDKNPIEVDSAFGGLGIYKKSAILSSTYVGLDENEEEFCEHVYLHRSMRDEGARLYIVPSLINCGWNEHSEKLRITAIITALLRHTIIELIKLFVSIEKLKTIVKKIHK